MTSFFSDTQSQPLIKVLLRKLQHFLRHSCDSLGNGKFQLFDRAWSVRVHSTLEVYPQKRIAIRQIRRTWGPRNSAETVDDMLGELLDAKHTMLFVPMRHSYLNYIV